MTVETTEPPKPPATRTPRRRRRFVLALAGLVVIGAAGFGYYRWSHPSVFDDLTGTQGSAGIGDRRAVPDSMAYGMSYPRDGLGPTSVDVIDARPDVVLNSSGATFRVVVCTIDPSAGVGAIGAIRVGGLSQECSRVVPAHGATMNVSPTYSDQLVLEVTPHRSGVVRVRGLDATYRSGWQRGTQHLGIWVKVTTP